MCGIIGYTGPRRARELVVSALERLEYRGYDSAGVCFLGGGRRGETRLERVRAAGPVSELVASLNGHGADSRCGLGHTRWATHGRVTVENAHPFLSCDGGLALVLNGIVENFGEQRAELSRRGHRFDSETDAEVVCHLVEERYEGDLAAAVAAAARELEGHFAFVCCHRDHPELLVGTRRECPLVVGRGAGETFLASSTSAFLAETRRIQLVEDDEVVVATPGRVRFYASGRARRRPLLDADWADEQVDRGEFETLMLKEIHEQPLALRETLASVAEALGRELPCTPAASLAERLVLVACGTSYHAALAGRHLFERWSRIPCEVEVASEWRYREPLVDGRTLVLGISQSGETADTLAALRQARRNGLPTLAVTNTPGSQLTREADGTLLTRCGLELGVAATKTFTAQVTLLASLALALAEGRGGLRAEEAAAASQALRELPALAERFLVGDHPINEIAERYADAPYFFFLGRGTGLAVALEGALKLREIAYIPCEAYPAGEMKHGPIALIDEQTPVVCVATERGPQEKISSNIQEVRARGGRAIALALGGDEALQHYVEDVVYVPRTHPLLQPVLDVLPLQMLAHRTARMRGVDPDRPRNLAKTVTVE